MEGYRRNGLEGRDMGSAGNDGAAVKIAFDANQETNLDELMAHLSLMQGSMPEDSPGLTDPESMLADFSIHQGELTPVDEPGEGPIW